MLWGHCNHIAVVMRRLFAGMFLAAAWFSVAGPNAIATTSAQSKTSPSKTKCPKQCVAPQMTCEMFLYKKMSGNGTGCGKRPTEFVPDDPVIDCRPCEEVVPPFPCEVDVVIMGAARSHTSSTRE